VAARAGVSKASVYLRYRGKADLATAALAHLREAGGPEPTGDLRRDLAALLRTIRRNVERASAMALIGVCLAEEARTPELLRLFRERSVGPRRDDVLAIVLAARARGAVRADVPTGAVVDLVLGALHSRHLSGEPAPEGWEEAVVDVLVGGLAPRG
jgi:AcrR family transcriptional regulator